MSRTEGYRLHAPAQLRELLVSFRKRQKQSQAALAEKLGISQQSYAQIEANPMATSVDRLYRILRLLDVDLVLTPRGTVLPDADRHGESAPMLPAMSDPVTPPVSREVSKLNRSPAGQAASSLAPARVTPPNPHPDDCW